MKKISTSVPSRPRKGFLSCSSGCLWGLKGVGLWLLFFLLGGNLAQAQDFLRFKSQTLAHHKNIESYDRQKKDLTPYLFEGKYYVLVEFETLPSAAAQKGMQSDGIRLLQYMPDKAYFASIEMQIAQTTLQKWGIKGVWGMEKIHKTDARILNQDYPEWTLNQEGYLDVTVILYDAFETTALRPHFTRIGASILSEELMDIQQIFLRVPFSRVEDLIAEPWVMWVESLPEPMKQENFFGKSNHRSAILEDGIRNLTGEGVSVGIWEAGGDFGIGPHLDFTGRLTQVQASAVSQHAAHVGGIVGGAGHVDPYARGMATKSSLYGYGAGSFGSQVIPAFNDFGVVITSNSYGGGPTCPSGTSYGDPYGGNNRTQDLRSNSVPTQLHVFSAGNSGTSCTGGWGTTTGKAAKNTLTVANVTRTDALAGSSSRGPLQDGRIKPEISALGTNVNSTNTGVSNYVSLTGTSMACPGVSGTIAQLVQRYRQLNSGANPLSSLMKALVCNNADDLGNAGPDYRHGFGRINGLRAVKAIEENRFLVNNVTTGGVFNHTIAVPAGAVKLHVMVVWNDPAAATNANPSLVNNLDLSVINGATTWLPWVLDPTIGNQGNLPVRAVNNRDNIEQVTIDNPTAGTYTLRINGTAVPSGANQEFSLTWTVDMPYLETTFPAGGESFEPNQQVVLAWDGAGISGNQTLQYSTDNGITWTNISTTVAANLRRFTWTVPNTITSQALIRVSNGTLSAQTLANFSIMPRVSGLATTNCNAGVVLDWNAAAGATSYNVYQFNPATATYTLLGNTTTNNFFVSGLTNGTTYWFTVRAFNAPNNALSQRATAVSATPSAASSGTDLEMVAILSPIAGCATLGANEAITVRIKNVGCTPIAAGTNIPLNYTETVTATNVNEVLTLAAVLSPGQTLDYTFTATANLSASNTYNFASTVSLPADGTAANNFVSGVQVVNSSLSFALPYCEDFENPNPGECWRRTNDPQPPGKTAGFQYGTNLGSSFFAIPASSQYAASNDDSGTFCGGDPGCDMSNDFLISPKINLVGYNAAQVSFNFVFPATDYGSTAFVKVSADNINWTTIHDFTTTAQNNAWQSLTLSLNSYVGQQIWVKFHHDDNGAWATGLAIDNVCFSDPTPPNLTAFTPTHNSTGVAVGTNLTLTFDEYIALGTGNITLSDGTNTILIPINSPQVSIANNVVTINPSSDLDPNTTYTVTFPTGVLTDLSGNPFAGVTAGTWSFTTESLPCSITGISAGAQTACDPATNQYSQTVTVTYS
ncbi:S8 family serine peptidase, partial [Hugenholtzia roseola]|uniref:S8 family serine peptidase n=1 Tax=Hugenholtzia roseola TaxID=1002 RepID=UPI00047C7957